MTDLAALGLKFSVFSFSKALARFITLKPNRFLKSSIVLSICASRCATLTSSASKIETCSIIESLFFNPLRPTVMLRSGTEKS